MHSSLFWRPTRLFLQWFSFSPTRLDLRGCYQALASHCCHWLHRPCRQLTRTQQWWWPRLSSGWCRRTRSRPGVANERRSSLGGNSLRCRAARLPSPPPSQPLSFLYQKAPSAVPLPLAPLSSRGSGTPRFPSRPSAVDAGSGPPPRRLLPLPPHLFCAPLCCRNARKLPRWRGRELVLGETERIWGWDHRARPLLLALSGRPPLREGPIGREDGSDQEGGRTTEWEGREGGERGVGDESVKEERVVEPRVRLPRCRLRAVSVRVWHQESPRVRHRAEPVPAAAGKVSRWSGPDPSAGRHSRPLPHWAWRCGCCRMFRLLPGQRRRCCRGRWESTTRRSSSCSCQSSGRRSGHLARGPDREGRGDGGGGGGGRRS